MIKKPIVLIVDDNPISLKLASETLHKDYDVRNCTSGLDALAFCQTQTPDLILMDIVMPDLDGLSACKKLKSESASSHIPIIFLTSESTVEVETTGWEAGCSDFIVKPFILATLKNRVKFHVEAKQNTDKLKQLASVDGLTGVYNRHFLDKSLLEQLKLSRRDNTALGLLMIDIDYFKQYNDTYGHLSGDTCLQQIAKCIESSLDRPTDLVARYGGEEFVVVLPNTPQEGVKLVAQRIMQAIFSLEIPHSGSNFTCVTVSIGGISAYASSLDHSELLGQADQQLYSAKRSGRNCFESNIISQFHSESEESLATNYHI
jgi:diguanylate cyclase (GGDEF)-like protein